MLSDYEKHNEAIRLGWRTIFLMGVQLDEPETYRYVYAIITSSPYVPKSGKKQPNPLDVYRRGFFEANNKTPFR